MMPWSVLKVRNEKTPLNIHFKYNVSLLPTGRSLKWHEGLELSAHEISCKN